MDVSFVIPVKGRLKYLKKMLPILVQAGSYQKITPTVIIVDYDCPDQTASWVSQAFPNPASKVRTIPVKNKPLFHLSHARNVGAKTATSEYLAFIDCDMLVQPSFFPTLASSVKHNSYLVFCKNIVGHAGFTMCKTVDFKRVEGFDEAAQGYGWEDTQFKQKLSFLGLTPVFLPLHIAVHIEHSHTERSQFYSEKNLTASNARNKMLLDANLERWKQKLKGNKP